MMKSRRDACTTGIVLIVAAGVSLAGLAEHASGQASTGLVWQKLPPLPDPEGFAAPFAGASGGALIVAGGANFPEKRPWEGGAKRWYDSIYVLPRGDASWRVLGRLARPLAYGVSCSDDAGVICAGGGDAERHYGDVFRLRYGQRGLTSEALPRLPQACAFASGAVVGRTFYIAGGIDQPSATTCLNTFWALELSQRDRGWRELEPCPGAERMLAMAGAAEGAFFLLSGTRLSPGADGKPVRQYLRDAWRYTPGQGWKRLADLPRAAVAAPSPAPLTPQGQLLVISGDDGSRVDFKPETDHPGFPRNVLAYDVKRDSWSVLGAAPFSRATVPTVVWNGQTIIASGEARPGYRSPEVWSLRHNHRAK